MNVDTQLRALAEKAAGRYTDSLLTAQGWTRAELVDAIHARLRSKYADMRDIGHLIRDTDGLIHLTETDGPCPTPQKHSYRSKAAATRSQRRRHMPHGVKDALHPYRCPAGDHWHLTHQTPAQQAEITARIAKHTAPPTRTQQTTMSHHRQERAR